MVKRFMIKKLFLMMSTAGMLMASNYAMASAFQLWELDAVSVGDYHAGNAAIANDASTSFNNPAGLILVPQELLAGGSVILTNFKFDGTVQVGVNDQPGTVQPVAAQGGGFNFVPFGHYATPINKKLAFGLSIVIPFGLKTDYGANTAIRYSAILSSIKVIDLAPSLAAALTDQLSIGVGLDIQHMNGEFTQVATDDGTTNQDDTLSRNTGSDTAYGYHLGALYQFSSKTRIGLAYHSQVVHHLKGDSVFTGFLSDAYNVPKSNQLSSRITLPPITTLSFFHELNNTWDLLGSISYIQWSSIQQFILNNTAGVLNSTGTNTLPVVINAGYNNTWNYSVGANYHVDDQWLIRGGLGYDQTPTVNAYRNLQLPDSNRIALALGAHYQATKALGFDAGWTHVFAMNTRIHNVSQVVGDETVTTNGSIGANADVYAFQLIWNFA